MDQFETINRPDLPLLESALLWSIRAWGLGRRDIGISLRMGRLFENLRAPEAMPAFDAFMASLRRSARRRLEIGCICQPRLNPDEFLLLDTFALLQEAHEDEASSLLGQLVLREAVHAAGAHALNLTLSLNAAGHFLPRAAASLRRHAFCHLASRTLPQRETFN